MVLQRTKLVVEKGKDVVYYWNSEEQKWQKKPVPNTHYKMPRTARGKSKRKKPRKRKTMKRKK